MVKEYEANAGAAPEEDVEQAGPQQGTLADFLEQVSLIADADAIPSAGDEESERIAREQGR